MNRTPGGKFSERSTIVLNNSDETPYWCELFAVTEAHLISAVEAVGNQVGDVQRYLQQERERATSE